MGVEQPAGRWRALCLTGIGLLLSGAPLLWFAGRFVDPDYGYEYVGHGWNTDYGPVIAVVAVATAVLAGWRYVWARDTWLSGAFRTVLAGALFTLVVCVAEPLTSAAKDGSIVRDAARLDASVPLLFAGTMLVTAGAVLVVASAPWSAGRQRPRILSWLGVLALGIGVVAGPAAAGVTFSVVGEPPAVDATVAYAVSPASLPRTVTAERWRLRLGEPVLQIVAAGTGVVVLTPSGVVGIDGRTGKERWHYRPYKLGRSDAPLRVYSEGWTVVVDLADFGGPSRPHAFDAVTGRLLGRGSYPGSRIYTYPGQSNGAVDTGDDVASFYPGLRLAEAAVTVRRNRADCGEGELGFFVVDPVTGTDRGTLACAVFSSGFPDPILLGAPGAVVAVVDPDEGNRSVLIGFG